MTTTKNTRDMTITMDTRWMSPDDGPVGWALLAARYTVWLAVFSTLVVSSVAGRDPDDLLGSLAALAVAGAAARQTWLWRGALARPRPALLAGVAVRTIARATPALLLAAEIWALARAGRDVHGTPGATLVIALSSVGAWYLARAIAQLIPCHLGLIAQTRDACTDHARRAVGAAPLAGLGSVGPAGQMRDP